MGSSSNIEGSWELSYYYQISLNDTLQNYSHRIVRIAGVRLHSEKNKGGAEMMCLCCFILFLRASTNLHWWHSIAWSIGAGTLGTGESKLKSWASWLTWSKSLILQQSAVCSSEQSGVWTVSIASRRIMCRKVTRYFGIYFLF